MSAETSGDGLRVSVVITAWNAERYLGEALESVAAQTRPAHQVVVNDDGSTDGTVRVARRAPGPVEVIESPHEGISVGRNHALARVTGDVVAFLDADDLWLPTKLEAQCRLLEEQPDLDAVCCRADEFDDGAGDGHRPPVLGAVGPILSGTVVRTRVIDAVGLFRPGLATGDWLEWWGRIVEQGLRVAEVPEVLCRRRLHDANNSLVTQRPEEFLAVLREKIQRSRQPSG